MDQSSTVEVNATQKNPIEALNKDEIINKYKGLLGIAKKAKQAKDELLEENRNLKEKLAQAEIQKEADKKALSTMKELLEQFTENKLELATQLSELQQHTKSDEDRLSQLEIQKESLERQLERLTEDNESLLSDIDRMEDQLKQVNLLGQEQKKNLTLLEHEVNKLKEAESQNASLQNRLSVMAQENEALKSETATSKEELETLAQKYQKVKEVNSEQRKKFNSLKDRFVDVYRKLKKLKECKKVLLETQHEYGEAVSKWQQEIIKASQLLCKQMNLLKTENEELQRKLQVQPENVQQNANIDVTRVCERLEELQSIGEQAWKEHKLQNEQLKTLEEENQRLKQQESQQKDEVDVADLTVQLKRIKDENNALQCRLREQQKSEKQNSEMLEKIEKEKNDKHQDLLSQLEQAKSEQEQSNAEKSKLREQLSALEIETQRLIEFESTNRQLQVQIETLEKELNEKTQMQDTLTGENSELRERLEREVSNQEQTAILQNYEELLARYERKEREHADLLDEMRELNEALKGRGDVISRQQEKQQELLTELKRTTAQQTDLEQQLQAKERNLADKEQQLQKLRAEIDGMQTQVRDLETASARNEEQVRVLSDELQTLRHADAHSDIMSTSTISRAEELNRLREVDESYEEKYNKLRGLAVKLKKKLQEQTARLEELEQQKDTGEQQQLVDTLQQQQQQSQKQIESLKAELQKVKASRKQVNVLNLEIEAAEKSLSDATAKLTAKSGEVDALNETLHTRERTIEQLRKEITLLEAAKEGECAHAKELKLELDRLQIQLKDAVHGKQNALVTHKQLEQSHEQTKLELEELRLQLAHYASKEKAAMAQSQIERSALQTQLETCESILQQTQLNLQTAERALEDLRVEHLDYKVKAQAVLRKNQSKDTNKERELQEELVALRAAEKQLQALVNQQAERNAEEERVREQLRGEYEHVQRRGKELMQLVEELRQQNDHLAHENQEQVRAQQESLHQQRLQIESLDACHKQQLQALHAQIEQLQAAQAKQVRLPPTVGEHATTTIMSTTTGNGNALPNSEQSKIDFLLMEREDAEGSEEAAEALATAAANRKISNASRRSQHDFMPLDELLNVPMTAFSDTVTNLNANNAHSLLGRSDVNANSNVLGIVADDNGNLTKALTELQSTKERLHTQESHMRHLTALLAENEQDLAKLTQMNDMLKEELRRQERSVEREQHMQNSEYLKNVFLKFLTLNAGDERTRLVPVLNTILRLSREEVDMLNYVAKGQKIPTDNSGGGGGSRAWNLLSSWARSE